MTRNEVLEIMRDYGFTLNMEAKKGDDTVTYYFLSEPVYHKRRKDIIIIPSFSCAVIPETKEFQFTYAVPRSVNKLESGKCSPFTNNEHFFNICAKFESGVQVLYRAFNE